MGVTVSSNGLLIVGSLEFGAEAVAAVGAAVVEAAGATANIYLAINAGNHYSADKAKLGGPGNTVFNRGKNVLDNFDVDNAYVKPKHLSTTGGSGQKFLGNSKLDAEEILRDVMKNGTVKSIFDNGLTKAGNASYEIILDAGKTIGTRGETLVKIVLSEDGGMLNAYPIK